MNVAAFSDIRLSFNWARPPLPSLQGIDYFSIEAIGKSECGAAGVVFVETSTGSFCVKACTESIAVEYFSHLIFQLNKIEVPEIFLVPYTSYQWNVIKNTIELSLFKDEAFRRNIKSKMESPMLMLMEFVPSLSITYMGPQKAERIFTGSDEGSIERLVNLGRVFAMDTVINNSDRYPIVWDNNGNPENLLLRVKTNTGTTAQELRDPFNLKLDFAGFVAIDSRVMLLDRNNKYALPNLIKYEEKINAFLRNLLIYLEGVRLSNQNYSEIMKIVSEAKIEPLGDFKGIRKFIKKYSFFDIQPNSEFLIALGMCICYENLTRCKISRIERLLETLKSTSKKWKNADFIWEENLNTIQLDFIQGIFRIIEENFKDFEKTLLWIHEITGRKYYIDEKEALDPQALIDKSLKAEDSTEESEKWKKIASETAEEIEKIKKKRRMEEAKVWMEQKQKIKEMKEAERGRKAKKMQEQKALMELKWKQMQTVALEQQKK